MSKNSAYGLRRPQASRLCHHGVVGTAHGHVVGHRVEDQPHAVLTQGGDQPLQRRFAAQLGVDAGRVDHVVAMARAGAGLEDGRGSTGG
ncbi:hypothetical protein PPS11_20159 [Pseudomonas putida S11]|nr:hypothetical protein PPS11_20159 [Pseudomonas putida S11]